MTTSISPPRSPNGATDWDRIGLKAGKTAHSKMIKTKTPTISVIRPPPFLNATSLQSDHTNPTLQSVVGAPWIQTHPGFAPRRVARGLHTSAPRREHAIFAHADTLAAALYSRRFEQRRDVPHPWSRALAVMPSSAVKPTEMFQSTDSGAQRLTVNRGDIGRC